MYKTFYRILPKDRMIFLDGGLYHVDNDEIIKESNFFVKEIDEKQEIKIEEYTYNLYEEFKIKSRWTKISEIHYQHGNPKPISFKDFTVDKKKTKVNLSSAQSEQFVKNELFTKLFTLQGQNDLMKIIIFIGIAIACGIGYMIISQQGLI
jgi:hypothetical protein